MEELQGIGRIAKGKSNYVSDSVDLKIVVCA
jgi:hypothetical protein